MPLQYLLKGWGDANDGYQCYVHTIKYGSTDALNTTGSNSNKVIEKHYSGITGRNWLQRLEEHLSKVRSGSGNLFHQVWRESGGGEARFMFLR
jgi:hypothetical protein